MTPGEAWSVTDANELYEVSRWGKGYFSINSSGNVQVHPSKDASRAIDLKQLVDDLQARGITLPLLIRFSDILKHRLGDIHDAFRRRSPAPVRQPLLLRVCPIKVNQQRQVVEEVLHFGTPYQFGLEALAQARAACRDRPGVQRHADHVPRRLQGRRYIETVMLA